jgi:hypothetical protein
MNVKENVYVDRYSITGTVETVIVYLQTLLSEIPEECRKSATIDVSAYDDYGSSTWEVECYYMRPETEEEQSQRVNKEKALKARQEFHEKEMLRKLQEKYGVVSS